MLQGWMSGTLWHSSPTPRYMPERDNLHTCYQETYTRLSAAKMFTRAKDGKQSKCSQTEEWISKMKCFQTMMKTDKPQLTLER